MRLSDFVNHSYDYRPNWTPLSPVTITNTLILFHYRAFCLRIPTGRRRTSWLLYKRGRGLAWTRDYRKHIQVAVRVGLEVGASGLQVRRSNRSSKLPLTINHLFKNGREMEGCPGLLFIATFFEIFDLLSELDQPLNNIVPKKVSKGFKSVRI